MRFRTLTLLVALTMFSTGAYAATYTVTTTADSGAGSLRQAILDANANAGLDTIDFNIAAAGVQTITPLTALPTITSPVTIDGYTQPGASANTLALGSDAVLLIELSGASVPSATGLWLTSGSDGSTVRGLVINRFTVGLLLQFGDNQTVEGNYIGTDATGMIDRGNTQSGLFVLDGVANSVFGGTTPAARNIISGNSTNVSIGDATSPATLIEGNYIGVDATGNAAVPGVGGISLNSVTNYTIYNNVISGNSDSGIAISNPTSNVTIMGNTIGLGANGSTVVANGIGVKFYDGFSGTPTSITIGTAAYPNVISGNGRGITTEEFFPYYMSGLNIQYNSIYNNTTGLGIDLNKDGVTPNDAFDGDTGPNGLQNFPVIATAQALNGNLTIAGTLASSPSTTYTIQFFRNSACDASGYGEGESYLGETNVTTDGAGNASFNFAVASGFTTGAVTATARNNATSSTSEFSQCASITVPAQPSISISDPAVIEGNAGTTSLSFVVTLSATSASTVTVNFATADGTATTADSDYVNSSGTVTFVPGDTSEIVNVTVNGDATPEPDETVLLNLTSPSGATISDAQGVGTIRNDDSLPGVSIADGSVAEGNAGTTALNFTLTLSASQAWSTTVDYYVTDGTAIAGSDFVTASGTVLFPAGSTSQNVTVNINGDTTTEANETFIVTLTNPSGMSITDGQATGTITNDDAQPQVSVNDPSVTEGNVGTKNLSWTLTLDHASAFTISVPFSIVDGTATAGVDYNTNSGSATFTPGKTSTTVGASVIGDTTVEPDETIFFNLTSATNATILDNQGTGTILNDDIVQPNLSVADVSQAEGSGASTMTFTITLSPTPNSAGTITYNTSDGTATAGSDYTATSSSVGFNSGDSSVLVSIPITGDQVQEGDETFFLNLLTTSVGVISDNQATGTILNDDAAPNLTVTKSGPASVNPGDSFAYTIDVLNGAGGTATGVIVTDPLPAGVVLVNATATQGSCSGTTTVTCNLGDLLPGGQATVTVNVTAGLTPGPIPNTATALADQIDSAPADNASTAATAIAAPAVAIPTASEWGLLALALTLGLIALLRVRT